jgi:hypothetical protein
MFTNNRIPQTIIIVSIVAVTMLGAALLFPAVNSASSEPGKQAPSKQSKNHNRLINESSPYLLQHAANPVNWYPWNEEAFAVAKREDKPIFLSNGWCRTLKKCSTTKPC